MLLLMFAFITPQRLLSYVSPGWIAPWDDIYKVAAGVLALFGLYALFEARQKKVIRGLIHEQITPSLDKLDSEISAVEQRTSRVEGALEMREFYDSKRYQQNTEDKGTKERGKHG